MTNTGDQTNAGGDQAIRIAITPTWEAIAKISIEALLNGTTNGKSMAREEIIDLGIKLDDAKEIIEEQEGANKAQSQKLKGQCSEELEALKLVPVLRKEVDNKNHIILNLEEKIEEKDKAIAELVDRVDKLGKTNDNLRDQRDEWKQDAERITGLKACIKDLENTLAFKNQTIVNLNGAKADLQKYWDERNSLQPGLPGIKHEDPIHNKILDLILDSEVAKRNKLTDYALDLVGVRELMVYTINQQIKHNETYVEDPEDPEYDAELANGDGQDTSIDEQVANNQPYREGDE